MEWKIYDDPVAFSEKVESLLYKNEDIFSLFLGILGQINNGRYEEYYLALAEEGKEVLAACLMTPPHPLQLIIFKEIPGLEANLARHLKRDSQELPGVIGDKETAGRFAEAWSAETGAAVELHMDEGLYRIDALAPGLEKSRGSWRVANKRDAELLEEWYLLFEKETGIGSSSHKEASMKIGQFLEDKEVYVWEVEGETVACMKKARPSKHGITVSFVFTPEKYRRKGYARTLVAEVTEELLLEYYFVMLYTDLKNPTANKMYNEIGYEKIANPVHLKFI
ncbi:GNAT family N-acetyltransferase [Planococcus salinarum]|uniref:GNAT family N-acetyltransferase n=1 Tax=Planococcus salinarum TaxID=622695 RepID=UPI000E3BF712|nr:GNAT family N-acetyltransferase [Planococcus salinarum]TAA71888.1 GNAT family N-acetyltransferase [Planococcus salinarum]